MELEDMNGFGTKSEDETLMSVPEAAKFLGVSPITVWRKLGLKGSKREMSCYRFGYRVLLSKERHLIPYLRAHEQISDSA
jgi:hypothetical protein